MELPQTKIASPSPAQRPVRQRKLLLAAVALSSGVTLSCSDPPGIGLFDAGFYCPNTVGLESVCGFESVTTTCAGGAASCNVSGTTSCDVSLVTASCTVLATLGDGTLHSVSVTFGENPSFPNCTSGTASPNYVNFTCTAKDAAVDAPVDAPNASDAAVDADQDGG